MPDPPAQSMAGATTADARNRRARRLSNLGARIAEGTPQVRQRIVRGRSDSAEGVTGTAPGFRIGTAQHGAQSRQRRACGGRADVADVLRSPGSHAGIGIPQRGQERRQRRPQIEPRLAIREVPPATAHHVHCHSHIAPHLRVGISQRPGECRHAHRAESVELRIDMLASGLQGGQGRRGCLRGGKAARKRPHRQGELAQLLHHRRCAEVCMCGGRGRRAHRQNERCCGCRCEMPRAQTSGARLLESPPASSPSAHALILASGRRPPGDSPGSRLRGSKRTISPGAFDAAMQLRPVDFARYRAASALAIRSSIRSASSG